ncbi:hypothetical protein B2J93_2943 [Marssonina coronariae]|uniref:Uncharacterized protein n=1 Tax=Diplocarpon coronariae TaxID=2795749 RepID=A0A218Z933_9HELO|nr:hypothetical protein JHW43_008828 [Diplocarpon mali]OWP04204.1 hypothetical protein B2J93_2943 [Marssonina coronariae]
MAENSTPEQREQACQALTCTLKSMIENPASALGLMYFQEREEKIKLQDQELKQQEREIKALKANLAKESWNSICSEFTEVLKMMSIDTSVETSRVEIKKLQRATARCITRHANFDELIINTFPLDDRVKNHWLCLKRVATVPLEDMASWQCSEQCGDECVLVFYKETMVEQGGPIQVFQVRFKHAGTSD